MALASRPFKWFLGDFTNGNIIESAPMEEIGGGIIDMSTDGEDTASITITLANASQTIRNNWDNYYKEVLHFAVCVNTTTNQIVSGGMVNKIVPNIADSSLDFQLINLKEYLRARIVGETFNTLVEDPTAGVLFEASDYTGIIGKMIQRAFALINMPNVPQPPQVLGSVFPAPTGDAIKKTVLYSDSLSYMEAIESAIEDSGVDIEVRFVPRWANNVPYSRVVWDAQIGTNSVPHLNENASMTITLSDADTLYKISEFSTVVDSTELYNSFYISSKAGDEKAKNGMDLKNSVNASPSFPILLEKYYNPGVELTEAQRDTQLNSYIAQGLEPKRSGSIALELEDDRFKLWASSYLGRIVNFVGVENTISAGNTIALRVLGVRIDTATGRVTIDLMSKMPKYPKLPRKRATKSKKKESKTGTSPRNKPVKTKDLANIDTSGGGTVVPPWNPGGEYPPSDAGPGGQWGTGSETVKDDNAPYEISNYEKDWGVSFKQINTQNSPTSQVTGAQNLSNVIVTIENYGKTYTWPVDFVGVRTVSNSTTPNEPLNWNMGSGYLSDGDIVNYSASKNLINVNDLINDISLNHNSWGIEPPLELQLSGYYYDYVNTASIGLSHATIFIVRDNIFLASTLTFTSNYKRRGSTSNYAYTQKYTIFTKRKMLSWDQFGELEMIRNATISQGNHTYDNVLRSSRVGDYALLSTTNNIYVNNFSNYESINSGNWSTLPLMREIAGFTTTTEIIIGSVIVEGVRQSYLIRQSTGSGYKVFGLKLIGDNQPFAVHDDIWEDISHLFPFPTTSPSGTFCKVSSISGFLVASISSTTAREEFYMQDDTGNWRLVGGVNVTKTVGTSWNNSTPPVIHYQFGNWIYRLWYGITSPRAFHLRKIANWAIEPAQTNTTQTMSMTSDELASSDMISEGGK